MPLSTLLSHDGPLAKKIAGFVPRESQMAMADLVQAGIDQSEHVLVEAGTGTGKTFAYLIPVFEALSLLGASISGSEGISSHKKSNIRKVIIATGTKTLQDQLFYQDIPKLNELYNVKVALLKGRNNYVCPERLERHLKTLDPKLHHQQIAEITSVKQWYLQSKDGDLTAFYDAGEALSVAQMVTSTIDNCMAGQCNSFDVCPLYRARNKAMEAQLVVVNHHLLFANMALSEETDAGLLPNADFIIVDEAHDIISVSRQFFGNRLSSRQFKDLHRDLKNEQILLGNDDPMLMSATEQLLDSVGRLSLSLQSATEDLLDALRKPEVVQSVEQLDSALLVLINHLRLVSDRSAGLAFCYKRALRLVDLFALLTEIDNLSAGGGEYLHWLEQMQGGFVIHQSPVSMAETLRPFLTSKLNHWCFVSATLTVAQSFEHFKHQLGLEDGLEGKFDSPFDFDKQVKGYIPRGLPRAGSDQHTAALLAHVLPIIRANKGRTFFLFTSYRAMNQCAELLSQNLDISFLKQGDLPKKRLLEMFRQVEGCVLLATLSFWQGVDVSGSDLQCLIIDKLPFGRPDDPIEQVILKSLASAGINGFKAHTLPEAAMILKQGFGRLTRNESDQGLFILGDDRVITRSYGELFHNSLPQFEWYDNADQAIAYLHSLGADSA